MTLFKLILKWFTIFSLITLLGTTIGGYIFYQHITSELPDVAQLKNVQYQTPFSIYSKEGKLIAEFGEKKREPIAINNIPKPLIKAFLAAEDDRYYEHKGVDYKSIARASIQLLLTGEKKQGASTITMQVTRNFLLSREKTFTRKFKEIILALQIEKAYSKEKILELYLNKIYMGHHAYGVVAAAKIYYNKPLEELTVAEQAMLAGLPKAPSFRNPVSNPEQAKQRRDYVIHRMQFLKYIDEKQALNALNQPLTAKIRPHPPELSIPYIAEMVRKKMLEKYCEKAYTSGMKVHTTIDSKLQLTADEALRYALHRYDRRHGYRAFPHPSFTSQAAFKNLKVIGDTHPVRITKFKNRTITALLQSGLSIQIPWKNMTWARHFKIRNYSGRRPRSLRGLFKVNDIIRAKKLSNDTWALTQVPKVQGAFASLNPMNGALLALVGGFDFHYNEYNRATQSRRQPGSGFKPVIYATALKEGFSLASVINDSPISIPNGKSRNRAWRPQNYSHRFYGPTRVRAALYKSRNIVSIRLTQEVGIEKVIQTAKDFGFIDSELPRGLSLALGSGSASPLRMATMYSIFANGGFLIEPHIIDRIENHEGRIVFQANAKTACPLCNEIPTDEINETKQILSAHAKRVLSPQVNFLMNSVLRDVVKRGTATPAKVLGRKDLAGKTGTTNNQIDAWFNGFHPSIVASAWVGLDSAKTLGYGETGGKTALPMWIKYMRVALDGVANSPLSPPEGIVRRYLGSSNNLSGKSSGTAGNSWEYFIKGVKTRGVTYVAKRATTTTKTRRPPSLQSKYKARPKKRRTSRKIAEDLF